MLLRTRMDGYNLSKLGIFFFAQNKTGTPQAPRRALNQSLTTNHLPFNIPPTRSKSSSVPYSIVILPFLLQSLIRTLIPRAVSNVRCAARKFGSTHRDPPPGHF